MRFVFVPLTLFSWPQQWEVLVNCWSWMSTNSGRK